MMKQQKEHFHVYGKEKKDTEIEHYDVCMLGGGPAGLTAGIYASRYGLHTAIISKDIGGMINLAKKIENYPGFEGSGMELTKKIFEQAKKFGTEFLNSVVSGIKKDKTGFVIFLFNEKAVHSKTIIIALGTEKKKLKIGGEDRLLGRGVSYCVTCDANFFKNKTVAVIGGANSAVNSALILSEIVKKVYIIYKKDKLRADRIEIEKLVKKKNVKIIYRTIPKEIKGIENVKSLVIEAEKTGKGRGKKTETSEIKLDGVFVEIGAVPITEIANSLNIKRDEKGYIDVNENMETSIPGIFAAGDAVKRKLKQVVVAAAQGALAAKSAHDYLQKLR